MKVVQAATCCQDLLSEFRPATLFVILLAHEARDSYGDVAGVTARELLREKIVEDCYRK